MRAKRLSFYTRAMSLVIGAVLLAAISVGYGLIQGVRIGGPLYGDLVAGKDVVADVLPPPLYVIESYLEASRAMLDPASADERRARFERLKADYDARHAHWTGAALPPDLSEALLSRSHAPAERFFAAGLNGVFPALADGRTQAAAEAFTAMTAAYAEHRAEVNRVVDLAGAWNLSTERTAGDWIPLAMGVLGALAVAVVALVGAAAVLAERAVVRPLGRAADAMRQLAAGRSDMALPALGGSAEMAEFAAAMAVFAANARERAVLLTEVQQGREEAERSRAQLEQLAVGFLQDADMMKTVLDREAHVVRACAKAFETTVADTEAQAGRGLESSTAAAGSVRAVAAAAGQLSASTRLVARQTVEARRITEGAAERARSAEREVQALSGVAGQIRSLLAAISGIADQTNLLSLNATIEASRAGEAGRGFAVVAAEVKALATETARATGEVDRLLQEINGCTGAVESSIGRIVGEVAAISALTGEIAAAVAEQERATAEIAGGAEQASASTEGARDTSGRLASILRATRGEVDRVGGASRSLFTALAEFTAGTDRFLGSISSDMKERRRHIRHEIDEPAEVIVAGRRSATTVRDLSLSGAAVAMVPGVARGAAVTLAIGGREIPGECLWVSGSHFGLRFRQVLEEFPVLLRKSA